MDDVEEKAGKNDIEGIKPQVSVMEQEITVGDFRLNYLPPGPVDVSVVAPSYFLDINNGFAKHRFAQNSDRFLEHDVPANSMALYSKGAEFVLKTENLTPGCILQIGDRTIEDWFAAAEIDQNAEHQVVYKPDNIVADVGLTVIRMMTETTSATNKFDLLTFEALATAIGARGMAMLTARDGDINREMGNWSRRANKLRLQRAMDYANSNLSSSSLSVADMARAAELSSCHFATIFKAQTGETAYNYILRRRAELAKALIITTRKSFAQVAFESGFSNQAHLSTIIKKAYGTTPGRMRSG